MSLIIEGINLPKGAKALHIRVQSNGVVRYLIEGDDPVRIIDGARAIQIPKDHGRIGDIDSVWNDEGGEQFYDEPILLESEE